MTQSGVPGNSTDPSQFLFIENQIASLQFPNQLVDRNGGGNVYTDSGVTTSSGDTVIETVGTSLAGNLNTLTLDRFAGLTFQHQAGDGSSFTVQNDTPTVSFYSAETLGVFKAQTQLSLQTGTIGVNSNFLSMTTSSTPDISLSSNASSIDIVGTAAAEKIDFSVPDVGLRINRLSTTAVQLTTTPSPATADTIQVTAPTTIITQTTSTAAIPSQLKQSTAPTGAVTLQPPSYLSFGGGANSGSVILKDGGGTCRITLSQQGQPFAQIGTTTNFMKCMDTTGVELHAVDSTLVNTITKTAFTCNTGTQIATGFVNNVPASIGATELLSLAGLKSLIDLLFPIGMLLMMSNGTVPGTFGGLITWTVWAGSNNQYIKMTTAGGTAGTAQLATVLAHTHGLTAVNTVAMNTVGTDGSHQHYAFGKYGFNPNSGIGASTQAHCDPNAGAGTDNFFPIAASSGTTNTGAAWTSGHNHAIPSTTVTGSTDSTGTTNEVAALFVIVYKRTA